MTKKAEKEIYAHLTVMGETYSLLSPHPLPPMDNWLPEGTLTFLVTGMHGGKERFLIVKGDFVIDYRDAGETRNVIISEGV